MSGFDQEVDLKIKNGKKETARKISYALAGIMLVMATAIFFFMSQEEAVACLVLLAGVCLSTWGVLARQGSLIIPGSLVVGVGLGILVYEGPLPIPYSLQKGLFLLCFALGCFLLTFLTGLFTAKTQWQALIPGSLMAILGIVLMLKNF
jgi:hypothetical protein